VVTEVLLETAVVNALIVFNLNTPQNKLKITQFRELLVNEMLGFNQPEQNQTLPALSKTRRTKHNFVQTPLRCNRNRKLRKRCVHCYNEKTTTVGLVQACKDVKRITTLFETCDVYTCADCFV